MLFTTLFRLIGVPLTVLALALTLSTAARAGDGGGGPVPNVLLTPPSVALDGQGQAIVTTTLVCWGDAVVAGQEGHVIVTASLAQARAGGSITIEATCAAEPQTLTLAVASVTGHTFGPGRVQGMFGYEVYTSTWVGFGDGEIDQILRPVQAPAR